ncbi:MAG TPA: lytic transglycosylase domain-containing protein [Xanthobacteraceae bacterium]|nr:lytic transglycosylase domain-containing protein [Xanthobacteraceae bacterium]
MMGKRTNRFCLAATLMIALTDAARSEPPRVPIPRARSSDHSGAVAPQTARLAAPLSSSSALPNDISSADRSAIKHALDLIRRGKTDQLNELVKSISDPAGKKLVEWAYLRSDDCHASLERYLAFINANPGWPSIAMLRRRGEGTLWEDKRDLATIRGFFGNAKPETPKGRFAYARALIAEGNRTGAYAYVREAWRNDTFSRELEAQVLEAFPDALTSADHRARMDRRFLAEDIDGGMRIATRLGGADLAVAKARVAVIRKASNALALLEAIPTESRRDPGYIISRIQWLRRNDRIAEAGALMLSAPRDPGQITGADEWWVERRLLARKLLDIGDPQTAYHVARDAVVPPRENYRGEHEFTAGWIALRFLSNPELAMSHFVRVGQGTLNPITLGRSHYWQGRAAEAMGRTREAREHYESAARHSTAYYGQLARAKLGLNEIALRPLPTPTVAQRNSEVVRATAILYALGERDLVIPLAADLGERLNDTGILTAVGQVVEEHGDARSLLLIGKAALGRSLAVEHIAFPTVGIPNYNAIGPSIDRSVAYAIVRQESAFNQRDLSTANAMGLMQVTPEAGRYVAKKFNIAYNQKRLANDPVYNTQMGAAELGDLLQDYRGSYILSFAGYNAGRGRVREWVARYGDPRDPNVDPVDWVERIPFSETRNYVQRVMENMQVYRARLGMGSRLMIEADMHRGASGN